MKTYNRILLKVSGEALLGEQDFGIDYKPVDMIANEIAQAVKEGVQIAVVVGGVPEVVAVLRRELVALAVDHDLERVPCLCPLS